MADYLTYADIYGALEKYLKMTKGSKRDILKSAINQVYLNEIMVCDDLYPLFWMVDFVDSYKALDPSVITDISQAATGKITTSAAHGLVEGDIFGVFDVVGMVEANNRLYSAGTVAAATIEMKTLDAVAVNTTTFTAYGSVGKVLHFGKKLTVDVHEILQVALHDEQVLTPTTPEQIEKLELISKSPATPTRYYHRKAFDGAGAEIDQIIWFLAPNDNFDVRIWKVKQAARLSADADVPRLPYQFHDAIVAGVMARFAETENITVENQVIWPTIYSSQIEAIKSYNRRWWERHRNEQIFGKAPYLL